MIIGYHCRMMDAKIKSKGLRLREDLARIQKGLNLRRTLTSKSYTIDIIVMKQKRKRVSFKNYAKLSQIKF